MKKIEKLNLFKYKNSNTRIQIQEFKYKNSNTKIQNNANQPKETKKIVHKVSYEKYHLLKQYHRLIVFRQISIFFENHQNHENRKSLPILRPNIA